MLFRQYRKGDANDPDTYVAGITAILSDYPSETIRFVTDPRTGIAANPIPDPETGRVWTGMPNPADVKRACEAHYAPVKRAIQQKALEEQQLKEREKTYLPSYRPNPNAKLVTYGEFIKSGGARPIGRFEKQD